MNFQSELLQSQFNTGSIYDSLQIPTEEVPLPSKGFFYTNKTSSVHLEYLIAKDEDTMTNPTLLQSGKVIETLLKTKIKSPVNFDELLPGDIDAILLNLRTMSFGTDYEVKLVDPNNGEPFTTTIDLSKLKFREIQKKPNEKFEFSFHLKKSKRDIKFKLLSYKTLLNIEAEIERENRDFGKAKSYTTKKLLYYITEVDGNTDKLFISSFIDVLPLIDSVELQKEIRLVEPGVDTLYLFTETPSGKDFYGSIKFDIDFFFPKI